MQQGLPFLGPFIHYSIARSSDKPKRRVSGVENVVVKRSASRAMTVSVSRSVTQEALRGRRIVFSPPFTEWTARNRPFAKTGMNSSSYVFALM